MKKERHLIALDLDGTLLSDKKDISEKNRKVIHKAIKEGHIVVIATGRPHRSSITYYHELNLDTPMVNFNGALIHHPTAKKWDALHNPMSKRAALRIIEACYDLNVHNILAEVQDSVFLDQYDEDIINIFQSQSDDPPFVIGSLKNNLQNDPTSLLIHPHEDKIQTLKKHLDDEHAELIEHRNWGAPWNIIEIVKKGINKSIGLEKLAHYYHIHKDQIIAFGDEDNDLEMIDYAGVGVAMENGIDELKSIAKYTTETNENSGVGTFLEKYLDLQPEFI
ncbi:MAG TPA: Cof-type HAD-IIB family hydrolase [Virgibacillus sp.]|nr:Cof-type HAD-IIB family hydrolase [Virgibacillus sp.]